MGDDPPTAEELDRLQWTTLLDDLHESNPAAGAISYVMSVWITGETLYV